MKTMIPLVLLLVLSDPLIAADAPPEPAPAPPSATPSEPEATASEDLPYGTGYEERQRRRRAANGQQSAGPAGDRPQGSRAAGADRPRRTRPQTPRSTR